MAENIKQQLDTFTMPLAGYSLIEASAGSGKTYTIVNLYLRLLLRLGDNSLLTPLGAEEILVVTFTRAATNEMSQRIRRVLVEYSLMLRDLILELEEFALKDGAWQEKYSAELQRLHDELARNQELRAQQGKFAPSAEVEQTDCFYHLPQNFQDQAIDTILTKYKKSNEDFFLRTLNQLLVEGRLLWAKQRLEQELARDRMQIQTLDSFTITALKNFGISTAVSEFEIKRDRKEPIIEKALENFLIHEFSTEQMQSRIRDIPLFTFQEQKDLEYYEKDYFYGYWKQKNQQGWIRKIHFFNLVKDFVARYTLQDINNLWRKCDLYIKDHYTIGEAAETDATKSRLITSAQQLYELQIARVQHEHPELQGDEVKIFNIYSSDYLRELREWQVYVLHWVYQEVMRIARQERVAIDYSDYHRELLELVRLENSPIKNNIRKLYKFAIIDEFQDTSPLQFALFNEIFIQGSLEANSAESNSLNQDQKSSSDQSKQSSSNENSQHNLTIKGQRGFIVIGDPKQAIYAFRGADIFCYFNARNLAQNIYTIAYNFRSESSFVETCNLMFGVRKDAFHLAHIEYEFAKPKREMGGLLFNKRKVSPITIGRMVEQFFDETISVHQYLARLIQVMIKLGEMGLLQIDDGNNVRNLLPSDICVIEQRNSDIDSCVAELRKVGINTQSNTKINLASDKDNKSLVLLELKTILGAIVKQDSKSINQSLFSIFSGYTFEQAKQILNDSNRYADYLQELRELYDLWKTKGFAALIDEYILKKNLFTQAKAQQSTNPQLFIQLQELRVIVDFVVSKCEFINTNNPYRILKYLENLKDIFTSEEDLELHALGIEDQEAVKFYTAHGSKGLEFPVVLSTCIAYDDSKNRLNINHLRPNCTDFYNLKKDEDKSLFGNICDAEKQRLFYVLLTRAKYAFFALNKQSKAQDEALTALKEGDYTEYYDSYQLGSHKQEWISHVVQHSSFEKVKEILKEDVSLQKYQTLVYRKNSPRIDTLINSLPWSWVQYLKSKKTETYEPKSLEENLQTELIYTVKDLVNKNKNGEVKVLDFPWMAINPDPSCADVSLYETIRLLINQKELDYALLSQRKKNQKHHYQQSSLSPTISLEKYQAETSRLSKQLEYLSSWISLAQPQAIRWQQAASDFQEADELVTTRKQVVEQLGRWLSAHMQTKSTQPKQRKYHANVVELQQGAKYLWLEHQGFQLLTQPFGTLQPDQGLITLNTSSRQVQIAQNYTVAQDLVYQQDLISYSSLKKYTEHLIPLATENFEQLLSSGKVLKSSDVSVEDLTYDFIPTSFDLQSEATTPEEIQREGGGEDETPVGQVSPDAEEIRLPESYLRKQKEFLLVQQQCWNMGNELVKLYSNLENQQHKLQYSQNLETESSNSPLSLEAMFEFLHSTKDSKFVAFHQVEELLNSTSNYATWSLMQWQDLLQDFKELVENHKRLNQLLEQNADQNVLNEVQQVLSLYNNLQVSLKEVLEWLNTNLHGNVFEPSEQHLVNLNNPSFILENLPRGKEFGQKVHTYLEKYHPTQGDENIRNLTRTCRDYNAVETQVTKKLIYDALNYPLLNLEKLAQGQVLGTRDWVEQNNSYNLYYNPPEAIDEKQYLKLNSYGYDRVTEWEFDINLALESMDFLGFCEILHRHGVLPQRPEADALHRKLRDLRTHGTFNGFVDLMIFTPQACVIIDYKTDNLGNSLFNYHPQILSYKMLQTGYILQSYIYLTAVFSYCLDHVFTTQDDINALRNLKFVGIHAFLRGMLKDNDQKYLNSGVYMEVPSHKLLAELALHLAPYLPYREGRMELLQLILSEA